MFQALLQEHHHYLKPDIIKLYQGDKGQPLHSLGHCNLKLHIRACTLTQPVQVIQDLWEDALMGKNFICQHPL
jgi:hypothetical protein